MGLRDVRVVKSLSRNVLHRLAWIHGEILILVGIDENTHAAVEFTIHPHMLYSRISH